MAIFGDRQAFLCSTDFCLALSARNLSSGGSKSLANLDKKATLVSHGNTRVRNGIPSMDTPLAELLFVSQCAA